MLEGFTKGEKQLGIYEIEGDTFKVCFGRPGAGRPHRLHQHPRRWPHGGLEAGEAAGQSRPEVNQDKVAAPATSDFDAPECHIDRGHQCGGERGSQLVAESGEEVVLLLGGARCHPAPRLASSVVASGTAGAEAIEDEGGIADCAGVIAELGGDDSQVFVEELHGAGADGAADGLEEDVAGLGDTAADDDDVGIDGPDDIGQCGADFVADGIPEALRDGVAGTSCCIEATRVALLDGLGVPAAL